MIVVSNTSPLTNLAAIGQFELLRHLYGHLHIAQAVWTELNAEGRRWPGSADVAAADWIERHQLRDFALVTTLRRDLHHGEAESIALALKLRADLLLLDEKEGRHAAQRLGLRVIGIVGILLAAKTQGYLSAITPHLDALRQQAGFYLSDAVYLRALSLSGEQDAVF